MRRPGVGRRGPRVCRADDGSATILVVAGLGVLTTLLLSGVVVATAVTASHRARSAADLGALAGAAYVQEGQGDAASCARAGVMVARNGARLLSCAIDDQGSVQVVTAVPLALPIRLDGVLGLSDDAPLMAKARSRAGPSP